MKPPARQIGQSEEVNLLWKISQKLSWLIDKVCCMLPPVTTTSTTTILEPF